DDPDPRNQRHYGGGDEGRCPAGGKKRRGSEAVQTGLIEPRSQPTRLRQPRWPDRRFDVPPSDQHQPGAEAQPQERAHDLLPVPAAVSKTASISMPACANAAVRAGRPGPRRRACSSGSHAKTDSVSMWSFSTRPVNATISRTCRAPCWSIAACTTRSTDAATVGTTKRLPTFSPASNGSVHSFTSACRAEFAWIERSEERRVGKEWKRGGWAVAVRAKKAGEAASHTQSTPEQN